MESKGPLVGVRTCSMSAIFRGSGAQRPEKVPELLGNIDLLVGHMQRD